MVAPRSAAGKTRPRPPTSTCAGRSASEITSRTGAPAAAADSDDVAAVVNCTSPRAAPPCRRWAAWAAVQVNALGGVETQPLRHRDRQGARGLRGRVDAHRDGRWRRGGGHRDGGGDRRAGGTGRCGGRGGRCWGAPHQQRQHDDSCSQMHAADPPRPRLDLRRFASVVTVDGAFSIDTTPSPNVWLWLALRPRQRRGRDREGAARRSAAGQSLPILRGALTALARAGLAAYTAATRRAWNVSQQRRRMTVGGVLLLVLVAACTAARATASRVGRRGRGSRRCGGERSRGQRRTGDTPGRARTVPGSSRHSPRASSDPSGLPSKPEPSRVAWRSKRSPS